MGASAFRPCMPILAQMRSLPGAQRESRMFLLEFRVCVHSRSHHVAILLKLPPSAYTAMVVCIVRALLRLVLVDSLIGATSAYALAHHATAKPHGQRPHCAMVWFDGHAPHVWPLYLHSSLHTVGDQGKGVNGISSFGMQAPRRKTHCHPDRLSCDNGQQAEGTHRTIMGSALESDRGGSCTS